MGITGISIRGANQRNDVAKRQLKGSQGNGGGAFAQPPPNNAKGDGIIEIIPGKWYFAVHCKSCGVQILFFPDENRGRRPVVVSMPVAVPCPDCGNSHSYEQAQIDSVQAPPQRRFKGLIE